ncbi:MAG: molybdopterin-containing oxidoreductase family protein [Terriglobales bacterium]
MTGNESLKVVHAACPHDCPDACGVLISVDEQTGKAVSLRGDPRHPVTRGFLCAKVAQYLERVYSPERVLYPLRRKSPKGAGRGQFSDFERIVWDEALESIATRYKAIVKEFGGESILPYSYGGTLGALNGGAMDRRFFHRLGASRLDRTICSIAGEVGIRSVYGVKAGTEPEQFAHSRYIIAWGANIHGNNVHLWPFVEEAKRNGAKLVVIDPYRTKTARMADWHLAIRPGTDVALALGMMHVIIGERLYDADYVARFTTGFEQLREKVKEYAPQQVAEWTGISSGDIVRLAREYARTRPAAIRLNYGIQRSDNGGSAVRAVCMLPCLIGAWKDLGGGLQLSVSDGYNLNKKALHGEDLQPKPTRIVNMVELAKALNELDDPPVKALYVYNSNPAAVAPDHNAVVRGLQRPDLFTVVHEQFLTDTCDYADVVLPATTFFEHKDLQTAYGHYFLQISEQAIEPLGECRSNVETFRALAITMGFDEPEFEQSVDEMIDVALASGHPHLKGIDRARLEREGHVRLSLPVPMRAASAAAGAGGAPANPNANAGRAEEQYPPFKPFAAGFATASGKAEFYSEALKAQGMDPVVTFIPPKESRHTGAAKKFPLELLGRKCDNYLNSSFCNMPGVQRLEDPNRLEIGAADAAKRGIADGDRVRVFNERGEIILTAAVDGKVPAGVVASRLNWAKLTPGGQNINVLTSERLSDMGGGATFYSVLVEVEKCTL